MKVAAMKRIVDGLMRCLLCLTALLMAACAFDPVIQFPPKLDMPELKVQRLPVSAALVIPESVSQATYEERVSCVYPFGRAQEVKLPAYGQQVERTAVAALSQVFAKTAVVTDKSAAVGRYDILVEVPAVTLTVKNDGSCFGSYMRGIVGVPLFPAYGVGVLFLVSNQLTLENTAKVSLDDGDNRLVLADLRRTAETTTGRLETDTGGKLEVTRRLEANLVEVFQGLATQIAETPKVVQYARSLQGTPQERMAARQQSGEIRVAQAPRQPDIKLNEIPAFTLTPREQDVAVVIGIEQYKMKDLPKATYAARDAQLVKAYLGAMGFRERNIELLVNDDATFSNFKKTLQTWLPNRVKPDSRVVVYYSGHGAAAATSGETAGEAYLVPYDGDPNYLSDTGFPLARLYEVLGNTKAKEIVVVLDSCFSGAGGRSVLAKDARPLQNVKPVRQVPAHVAVLTSTEGAQISAGYPEKGHGLFTYYFLKALKEGKKTLGEIYAAVRPEVEDEAKRQHIEQTPSLSPSAEQLKGRFALHD